MIMVEATLKKAVQELNRVKDDDGGDEAVFKVAPAKPAEVAEVAEGAWVATKFAEQVVEVAKQMEAVSGIDPPSVRPCYLSRHMCGPVCVAVRCVWRV